jgi:hypothetical protein
VVCVTFIYTSYIIAITTVVLHLHFKQNSTTIISIASAKIMCVKVLCARCNFF